MATKPRKAPPHLYDPYFTVRHKVLALLENLRDTYPDLAQSGSYLSFRIANARHAAEAKAILAVIDASNAYPIKEDAIHGHHPR